MSTKRPQLHYESKIYRYLYGGGKSSLTLVGIPKIHWWGTEGDYNIMIIDLLGPSLADLLLKTNNKFSLKTVLMLADQMVKEA